MSSQLLALTVAGARLSPLLLVPLGAVLGGCLGYLLWGQAGRLDIARHRGFLAHLVGRPVQRLGLGRVCLQCGRMHYIPTTPRELWKGGHFCAVTCLVDAQAADEAALEAERTAEQRMRELFVYDELDRVLQRALTREALTREALARPLPRGPRRAGTGHGPVAARHGRTAEL
jgi:hypothetical protein